MGLTTSALTVTETKILDSFDSDTHMAVGTGTTDPTRADTTLSGEVIRRAIESTNKDTSNVYNEQTMRIPLDALGASVIGNYGSVDAASGGNFSTLGTFEETFTQSSGEEIYFTVRVKPTVVNT